LPAIWAVMTFLADANLMRASARQGSCRTVAGRRSAMAGRYLRPSAVAEASARCTTRAGPRASEHSQCTSCGPIRARAAVARPFGPGFSQLVVAEHAAAWVQEQRVRSAAAPTTQNSSPRCATPPAPSSRSTTRPTPTTNSSWPSTARPSRPARLFGKRRCRVAACSHGFAVRCQFNSTAWVQAPALRGLARFCLCLDVDLLGRFVEILEQRRAEPALHRRIVRGVVGAAGFPADER